MLLISIISPPQHVAWRILLKLDEQFLVIKIVSVKIQSLKADDFRFQTPAHDVLKNRQLKATLGFSCISALRWADSHLGMPIVLHSCTTHQRQHRDHPLNPLQSNTLKWQQRPEMPALISRTHTSSSHHEHHQCWSSFIVQIQHVDVDDIKRSWSESCSWSIAHRCLWYCTIPVRLICFGPSFRPSDQYFSRQDSKEKQNRSLNHPGPV